MVTKRLRAVEGRFSSEMSLLLNGIFDNFLLASVHVRSLSTFAENLMSASCLKASCL